MSILNLNLLFLAELAKTVMGYVAHGVRTISTIGSVFLLVGPYFRVLLGIHVEPGSFHYRTLPFVSLSSLHSLHSSGLVAFLLSRQLVIVCLVQNNNK